MCRKGSIHRPISSKDDTLRLHFCLGPDEDWEKNDQMFPPDNLQLRRSVPDTHQAVSAARPEVDIHKP